MGMVFCVFGSDGLSVEGQETGYNGNVLPVMVEGQETTAVQTPGFGDG